MSLLVRALRPLVPLGLMERALRPLLVPLEPDWCRFAGLMLPSSPSCAIGRRML